MRKTGLLSAAAPGLAIQTIGIAFSYAAVGITGAVTASLAAMPMGLLLLASERRRLLKTNERLEAQSLASALSSIYNDVSIRNTALGSAISNASKKIPKDSRTRIALTQLSSSLKSGSDMRDALTLASSSRSKTVSRALASLSKEFAGRDDSIQAMNTAASRLSSEIAIEDEKLAGAQQRNLTISMAASTVLPSFALFAFVGYSIVNYSAAKLSLFAALMLVVIPGMYLMIRSLTWA